MCRKDGIRIIKLLQIRHRIEGFYESGEVGTVPI